jgi:hypothetical protein
MSDEPVTPKRRLWWGLPASALLHVAIAVLLLLKLPDTTHQPPKDEAVKVDIVPEKEAPKPPEPPKSAAEKPPEPPPKAEEQAKVEDAPQKVPIPTLRPVFQFGEKDQGPDKQDGSASTGDKDAADDLADKKPDVPKAEEPQATAEEASKEPAKDDLPGVPDILKAIDQQNAASAAAAGKPVEKKAATPKPSDAKAMQEARRIFSDTALGGQAAVLAMGDMPRDIRISQLCATELREQLRHATPRYSPEMLPSIRLRYGTVLDVPKAAFRTHSDWYDLSFRCEVDEPGTRVVSFAFSVGDPVPQSQWRARGFPSQ